MKWTRDDHEDERLRVVEDGWEKVKVLEDVVRDLEPWCLLLAGARAFSPQRVGLMVVSARVFRLELVGGGIPVIMSIFEDDGGCAARDADEAQEDVGERGEYGGDGEGSEHGGAVGSSGGDDGELECGGDGGAGGAADDDDEEEDAVAVERRRKREEAQKKANKRWKEGNGYGNVLEFRAKRMTDVSRGGGSGRKTRSAGAAELEGITKIGRIRKK